MTTRRPNFLQTVSLPRTREGVITRGTKNGARMPVLHPGEMLREEFLIPLGMTAEMLAHEIKVPKRRLLAIVEEQRQLDADMCLRLGRYFRMSPQFWMGIEKDYELEIAMQYWPEICKEVPMHPKDRKAGALKMTKSELRGSSR